MIPISHSKPPHNHPPPAIPAPNLSLCEEWPAIRSSKSEGWCALQVSNLRIYPSEQQTVG
jgi:hypothetical protein